MRKDLKAPKSYPKKQSLSNLQLTFKSNNFRSELVDMDVSSDESILIYTQNKTMCVFKN